MRTSWTSYSIGMYKLGGIGIFLAWNFVLNHVLKENPDSHVCQRPPDKPIEVIGPNMMHLKGRGWYSAPAFSFDSLGGRRGCGAVYGPSQPNLQM